MVEQTNKWECIEEGEMKIAEKGIFQQICCLGEGRKMRETAIY